MIPLALKLKKERHRDIAKAQDLLIEEVYRVFDKAVLHGGTAIWRCYKGNRFSEDADFYLLKNPNRLNLLFKNLAKTGFIILKRKIGDRSLFSTLQLREVIIRFEAIFKKVDGILKEYETTEGNLITIYTLSVEDLIKEKISSYLSRLKIRDLYDVFFLLRYVQDRKKVAKELKDLISKFKAPVNEEELKVLIIEGLVPNVEKMLFYIKTRG